MRRPVAGRRGEGVHAVHVGEIGQPWILARSLGGRRRLAGETAIQDRHPGVRGAAPQQACHRVPRQPRDLRLPGVGRRHGQAQFPAGRSHTMAHVVEQQHPAGGPGQISDLARQVRRGDRVGYHLDLSGRPGGQSRITQQRAHRGQAVTGRPNWRKLHVFVRRYPDQHGTRPGRVHVPPRPDKTANRPTVSRTIRYQLKHKHRGTAETPG